AAGDKVFVDYSGKKIAIVYGKTGEIREAEIFVAVLGASSYTFAEAACFGNSRTPFSLNPGLECTPIVRQRNCETIPCS
ncbi:hypothetical protein, partial [Mesorhizobium sp.]|uniref:hypothetical protein n=1 Tax=Mesorhizobium sp. TaxID=1871066 RepID=UPI00257EDF46